MRAWRGEENDWLHDIMNSLEVLSAVAGFCLWMICAFTAAHVMIAVEDWKYERGTARMEGLPIMRESEARWTASTMPVIIVRFSDEWQPPHARRRK